MASEESENQDCPICFEALSGCLFAQPICSHVFHEKCWHKWILTYTGDPMRCQRCLQPVAQKALPWMLTEISRFGPEFPGAEHRPKVEELLTQLVALGESALLEDGGMTSASLTEEGSQRAAAHAILFAHFMLALLTEVDKYPDTFDREKHAKQLRELRSPSRIVKLAALIWEKEPGVTSQVPCISQLLRLENGTAEAHLILGRFHAGDDLFGRRDLDVEDLNRAERHLCEALRQQHPKHRDAGVALATLQISRLRLRLPKDKNRPKVEELLTQPGGLLNDEWQTSSSLTEEGSLRTAAHAILFAHYVLVLLAEVDQFSQTSDRKKHAKQLCELRSPSKIVQLAALMWEKEPGVTSQVPCISQLLRVENGTAEAHFILGRFLFESDDLGRAEHHLREAWSQHHPNGGLAFAELLAKLGKDAESLEVCEQVLSINQNHAKTNYHLGKHYLKCENLESAEPHLRRAFHYGEPGALYELGKALQERGDLNKAKCCFWDVHNTVFRGIEEAGLYGHVGAKSWAREELAKCLYRDGAREESLRLALINLAAWNLRRAASRLRDSLYWEPTMAAFRRFGATRDGDPFLVYLAAESAVVLAEVEHYFQGGCHQLTEGLLMELFCGLGSNVLVALGWGYEEQGQLTEAARCYHKAMDVEKEDGRRRQGSSVAEMSFLHLKGKFGDPRAPQEILAVKARISETKPDLNEALDKLEREIAFSKVIPQSIRTLFFEDAEPLQQLTTGQEPILLPDVQPATPSASALGASCPPADPPQEPTRSAPPSTASTEAPVSLEEDAQGEDEPSDLAPRPRPQLLVPWQVETPLPQNTPDDQDSDLHTPDDRDPDLQTALMLSCAEQKDLLVAVRTNPVLMRAQRQLLQPVPEEPTGEKLFLMCFQRNGAEFKERLHHGQLLTPCRAALEAAGHRWLLEDETGHTGTFAGRYGVKIFVHPHQYSAATELLSQAIMSQQPPQRLYPNHVVVAESFLPPLLESLQGCPAGASLKPQGQVELGEVPLPLWTAESNDPHESQSTSTSDRLHAYFHEVGMVEQKTFLHTPAAKHRGPVTQSDGLPDTNPRRRKACSSLSSYREAAPEEADARASSTGESRLQAPPQLSGVAQHNTFLQVPPEPVHQPKSTGAAKFPRRHSDQAADDVACLPVPPPAEAAARDAMPGARPEAPHALGQGPQALPASCSPEPLPAAFQPAAVQEEGQGPHAPTEAQLCSRASIPGQLAPPVQQPELRSCHPPAPADGPQATCQLAALEPKEALRCGTASIPGQCAPLLRLPELRHSATGAASFVAAMPNALPAMPVTASGVGSSPPAAPGAAFQHPASPAAYSTAQQATKAQHSALLSAEATASASSPPAPPGTTPTPASHSTAQQAAKGQLSLAEDSKSASSPPAPPGTTAATAAHGTAQQATKGQRSLAEATEFASSPPAAEERGQRSLAEATEYASSSPAAEESPVLEQEQEAGAASASSVPCSWPWGSCCFSGLLAGAAGARAWGQRHGGRARRASLGDTVRSHSVGRHEAVPEVM